MNNLYKRIILKKYNIRIISLILIIVVILFSSPVILYQNIIISVKDIKYKSEEIIKNIQYDELFMYLDSLNSSAKIQATIVADNIKDSIKLEYPDLSVLEKEMKNSQFSDKLIDIFENNIQDKYLNGISNNRNDMYIANYNGIIIDYSYNEINNRKIRRTWKEEMENHYNKKLYIESINRLLKDQSNGFIVQEKQHKHFSDNHMTISSFNENTMKKIFYTYGIEGFKNYTFLSASYIYNHEDMFGNKDIINGIRTKNNKIIIIQEFNIYDQIMENYSNIFISDAVESNITNYDQILNILNILGILLSVSITGLIFLLCTLYNWIMIIIRNKENEDK